MRLGRGWRGVSPVPPIIGSITASLREIDSSLHTVIKWHALGHLSFLNAAADCRSMTEGWLESSKKSKPPYWLFTCADSISTAAVCSSGVRLSPPPPQPYVGHCSYNTHRMGCYRTSRPITVWEKVPVSCHFELGVGCTSSPCSLFHQIYFSLQKWSRICCSAQSAWSCMHRWVDR